MTDGFPGQHTRPPPVAETGSVCWRSGQNQQRRTGATVDFGHRKRARCGSNPISATILCILNRCHSKNPRCHKASGIFCTYFRSAIFNRCQMPKSPCRWDLNFNNKCLASIFTRRIAKKTFIGSAKCIYRLISYQFRNLGYGM